MKPKRDFNPLFPNYFITGCPLTNQGLICSYTGFCYNCPFRLLLTFVNFLYDTDDTSLASGLKHVVYQKYGI